MPVSFSTQFIQFLTTIFNDSELVRMQYPITYGLVPVNWNEDEEEKLDETYTYVTGNLIGLSNRHSFDSHDELTIEGIKEDSQYIKLTDNDGNNLNKLLYDEDYLNNFNVSKDAIPVVVNAYAAHKYGLSVGDTLTLNITNSVDRYDQKLHPEREEYTDDYNKKTFKVVDISQGTNGSALYTSQYVANKVVGLPDGYSWNKTHKYMM
ncbi:MAG: hypothetical protein MJ223_01035 [Mycoplasmoidaceae bacterium]|nr:hypothetical protein [Mycoplasmoidaceae bacterium]